MKKLNKKGFTLVEVIVVLVILAILIAIAVPSVMKYIDDAKDAQVLAQAKGAVQVAEFSSIEHLAKNEAKTWKEFDDLVDKELQKQGYPKGVFGNSISSAPEYKDEWNVYLIQYNAKDDDGNINTTSYKKIDYSKSPRIESFTIMMVKKGSTRRYEYIPNQKFELISSNDW